MASKWHTYPARCANQQPTWQGSMAACHRGKMCRMLTLTWSRSNREDLTTKNVRFFS
jgi:hypothetical protein